MHVLAVVPSGFSSSMVMLRELSKYLTRKEHGFRLSVVTASNLQAAPGQKDRCDALFLSCFTGVADVLHASGITHPNTILRVGVDPVWDRYSTDGDTFNRFDAAFEVVLMRYKLVCYRQQMCAHVQSHGFDACTLPIGIDTSLYSGGMMRCIQKNDAFVVGNVEPIKSLRGGYREVVCPAYYSYLDTNAPDNCNRIELCNSLRENETGRAVEDMPSFYRSIDALASFPRSSSVGRGVLEAVACGTPLIGCDSGLTGDLIRQGAGLSCTRHYQDALRGFSVLASNREQWRSLSVAASKVGARYSWDIVAPQWCDFFKRTTNR